MIDARELRINNLIAGRDGELTYVNNLGYLERGYILVNTRPADQFKPIPLSEEVLIKCGFNNEELKSEGFKFYKHGRCIAYSVYDEDNEKYLLIDNNSIMYLHQLQNLFLDLTGKELEVNL